MGLIQNEPKKKQETLLYKKEGLPCKKFECLAIAYFALYFRTHMRAANVYIGHWPSMYFLMA
jgi:hypothetical protein